MWSKMADPVCLTCGYCLIGRGPDCLVGSVYLCSQLLSGLQADLVVGCQAGRQSPGSPLDVAVALATQGVLVLYQLKPVHFLLLFPWLGLSLLSYFGVTQTGTCSGLETSVKAGLSKWIADCSNNTLVSTDRSETSTSSQPGGLIETDPEHWLCHQAHCAALSPLFRESYTRKQPKNVPITSTLLSFQYTCNSKQ